MAALAWLRNGSSLGPFVAAAVSFVALGLLKHARSRVPLRDP
jgi:hypothetical protein